MFGAVDEVDGDEGEGGKKDDDAGSKAGRRESNRDGVVTLFDGNSDDAEILIVDVVDGDGDNLGSGAVDEYLPAGEVRFLNDQKLSGAVSAGSCENHRVLLIADDIGRLYFARPEGSRIIR